MTKGLDRDVLRRIEQATGIAGAGTPPLLAAQLRGAAEAGAVAQVLSRAAPPEAMAAAPAAPARGAMELVPDWAIAPGGTRLRVGAHWLTLGPLPRLCAQAWLRHEASGSDAPYRAPFTPGQVAVAEDYRALTEWREGSPLRCASLEAGRGGGGSGLFIDTWIEQGRWLGVLHARIGAGQALVLRRIRPSARGTKRGIADRALVDMVCLRDMSLSAVLGAHGWSCKGELREALRVALCAALDRMQGYGA